MMQSFFRNRAKQIARFAALWLVLLTTTSVFADTSKISPDLLPLLSNPSTSVNVIVQYNSPPQTCTSGGFLGVLLCTALKIVGGVVNVVFTLVNAVAATIDTGDIVNLSNQSNVTYIS